MSRARARNAPACPTASCRPGTLRTCIRCPQSDHAPCGASTLRSCRTRCAMRAARWSGPCHPLRPPSASALRARTAARCCRRIGVRRGAMQAQARPVGHRRLLHCSAGWGRLRRATSTRRRRRSASGPSAARASASRATCACRARLALFAALAHAHVFARAALCLARRARTRVLFAYVSARLCTAVRRRHDPHTVAACTLTPLSRLIPVRPILVRAGAASGGVPVASARGGGERG